MHNTEQQGDKYHNHAQVWLLLPWYINGSLPAGEKQRIAEHAAVCLICRKELGLQSSLRDSVKNHELDELRVSASFDRLSAKLQAEDAGLEFPLQDSRSWPGRHAGKFASALRLWLQQQFTSGYWPAVLSVLALMAILPGFLGNNTFRTLSDGLTEAAVTADLRLIFADGVAESDRDAILDRAGLSIVSGPDERGLYFVNAADDVSASALEATLEQLRSDEKIMFAEFAISAVPNSQVPGER